MKAGYGAVLEIGTPTTELKVEATQDVFYLDRMVENITNPRAKAYVEANWGLKDTTERTWETLKSLGSKADADHERKVATNQAVASQLAAIASADAVTSKSLMGMIGAVSKEEHDSAVAKASVKDGLTKAQRKWFNKTEEWMDPTEHAYMRSVFNLSAKEPEPSTQDRSSWQAWLSGGD